MLHKFNIYSIERDLFLPLKNKQTVKKISTKIVTTLGRDFKDIIHQFCYTGTIFQTQGGFF